MGLLCTHVLCNSAIHASLSSCTSLSASSPPAPRVLLSVFLSPLPLNASVFCCIAGGPLTALKSSKFNKECKHLRHEGLRNKELYYSVFDKYHAAGASGYGSVTMPDENPSYFDFDASMDNSAYRPIFEEDGTPTTGPRNLNNMQFTGYAGPSRSRVSSGKRKVRDEADEMTIQAMQEIVTHFRGRSQSGASNEQSSQTNHKLRCMNIMTEMDIPPLIGR
ncbi:hypothetical protein TIFTF001_039402 [Ficus carica]|uniref:Uncharacterized protein n=1 Tax=Ficus carica TaxID=3494 RepID=A0AA88E927_FICCA|nr:hypothetical protein TIFTF001_039402 [Ficus carica]